MRSQRRHSHRSGRVSLRKSAHSFACSLCLAGPWDARQQEVPWCAAAILSRLVGKTLVSDFLPHSHSESQATESAQVSTDYPSSNSPIVQLITSHYMSRLHGPLRLRLGLRGILSDPTLSHPKHHATHKASSNVPTLLLRLPTHTCHRVERSHKACIVAASPCRLISILRAS
jgi:hypothetical protein